MSSARLVTTRADVTAAGLADAVSALLADGWRLALVSAVDDGSMDWSSASAAAGLRVVYVFLAPTNRRHELVLRAEKQRSGVPGCGPTTTSGPSIPSLASLSYSAGRFEREMRDLFGLEPTDHPLPKRMVRHGHWPRGWYPMRRDAGPAPEFEPDLGSYPFLQVEGPGVYEIPVGPIHAGLIEPGHFRFSVVGETILRMKARLWFMHRGMEKLFEGRRPGECLGLAGRISGDTAVGHEAAFALAVEDALGLDVPEAVQARRSVLLELERLHNHVADLGMLANDVGFGIANTHAQRLRETLLRHNAAVTGHRLLRGAIGIGHTEFEAAPDLELLAGVVAEAAELAEITLGHGVVADRFSSTAILDHASALDLGTLGYVARASGVAIDARADHPLLTSVAAPEPVVEPDGDVRARYLVRSREIAASLEFLRRLLPLCSAARAGTTQAYDGGPAVGVRSGLGVVEAWRGTLVHRVELAPDGTLSRVKIVDPSWFNWPALPVALADTIVPDFPLANKSFNQSYAGNDL